MRKAIYLTLAIFLVLINVSLILPQVGFQQQPFGSQSTQGFQQNLNSFQPQNTFNQGHNANYQRTQGQYYAQPTSQQQFSSFGTNSRANYVQGVNPAYQTYNNGFSNLNNRGQYSYTQNSGNYGGSSQFGYNQGFNNQLCQQGQNFLITIAPGGCAPAVVRSDLLEEQNVPVYCRLSSLITNPLLSGTRIRSVTVSGELPEGIQGVTYFPGRAAINQQSIFNRGVGGFGNNFGSNGGGYQSQNTFGNNYNYNQYNTGFSSYGANNNFGSNLGSNQQSYQPGYSGGGNFFNTNQYYGGSSQQSPVTDNMGYIVVVLSRNAVESSMPDFVEGNITATIDYDSAGAIGSGQTTFYLDQLNEDQWQRDYRENSFWNAQAYIRASSIDQNTATISIYRDQNTIEQTVTLTPGQVSPIVNLGGNQCSSGMTVRLDKLGAPVESALLQINGEQLWVAKGDRIINNRCVVQNIITAGGGGKVSVSCPGSQFNLDLNAGKAKLLGPNQEKIDTSLYQKITENIFLGFIGTNLNGQPMAVLIRDSAAKTSEGFASREVFGLVEGSKINGDQAIIKSIIDKYNSVGITLTNADIQIARGTIPAFGIFIQSLTPSQDQQDFNRNPTAQTYYTRAISYYNELYDLYPNEKTPEGPTYAEKGLLESLELSKKFGFIDEARDSANKIANTYPDSQSAIQAYTQSNYLFKYDRTNAKTIAQVDNNQFSIDLLEFRKPSRLDASGIFMINGQETILGLGEFYNAGKTQVQLLNLNDDRALLGFGYDNNGQRVTHQETLIFGSRDAASVNDATIKLININLKKQAKVTILPNLYGSGSRNQVNFPVRIGIEKRAIQLSPETTKDLIKNLQDAIDEWNEINKKLGTVIKTLKAACFATSAVLTVKNLFESATGGAVARNRLMKSAGGWNDKCEELVNNAEYVSVQQCLLDKNDQIENDINIFSEQIQGTNGKLKGIQEEVGITQDNPFDFQGQTDANRVEEIFQEQEFNTFCNGNNNNIKLPGAGAKTVKYSDICDWDGMTHEQRREILTLSKIKEQGGSEVLQGYADRELGRITLDAQNTNEIKVNNLKSVENAKRFNLGSETRPIGDSVNLGNIKTKTNNDNQAYNGLETGDSSIWVNLPSSISNGDGTFTQNNALAGKAVIVKVESIEGSPGTYAPVNVFYTTDGKKITDDTQIKNINRYLSVSKLDRIKQADTKAFQNQMVDTENLRVKYFDRAPFKGLPSIVPFDVKEGWYVKTSYTLSGFGVPYDESGRAANYYICNVGANGLIEFKKSSDDICRYYNGFNRDLSFPGMNQGQSAQLVQRAQAALQDASRQFGQENININGQTFDSGVSFDDTDGQCTDFMSAQDCNILFNVCDPVICPSSRCDLGGEYRVDNVIQTGIVGSLALCLPNAQEGIAVPICLSGVHAGLDGYISILNSTVSCLNESLETGQNIGICDEIKSVYLCDFFWRQATPFLEVLLQKTFSVAAGQGARGGGEYLTVQKAWDNTQGAVDYFTGQYAGNSVQAFYNRNLGETQPIGAFGSGAYGGVGFQNGQAGYNNPSQGQLGGGQGTGGFGGGATGGGGSFGGFAGNVGGDICKSFISSGFSGGATNIFESLIEPDSPEQYTAWVSENPLSTATFPPTSHYKVYYHIYAGKDIGASYQVYLKGAPQTPGVFSNQFRIVDQGYIARGSEVDQAKDFTATSGFQELCININGREECGFGQVSTSYLVNSVTDKYAEEQAGQVDIVSENTCIAGSPSLYSLAQPNLQAGIQETLNPQLYNKGIVRICSTKNPGKQVLPTGEYDSTDSIYDKWKDVGYCDDPTIRCWLDTSSVKDIIRNTGIENQVLGDVNLNALGGGNYIVPEQSDALLSEARNLLSRIPELFKPSDTQQNIDVEIGGLVTQLETLSITGPNNIYRARAFYMLANIHRSIANLFKPSSIRVVTPTGDTSETVEDVTLTDPKLIRAPTTEPISENQIDISRITDNQLRPMVQISFDNTKAPAGKELRFFYAENGKWGSSDVNLGLFSLENAKYKQGVEILARQLIDPRTTIVSVNDINVEPTIEGIIYELLINKDVKNIPQQDTNQEQIPTNSINTQPVTNNLIPPTTNNKPIPPTTNNKPIPPTTNNNLPLSSNFYLENADDIQIELYNIFDTTKYFQYKNNRWYWGNKLNEISQEIGGTGSRIIPAQEGIRNLISSLEGKSHIEGLEHLVKVTGTNGVSGFFVFDSRFIAYRKNIEIGDYYHNDELLFVGGFELLLEDLNINLRSK